MSYFIWLQTRLLFIMVQRMIGLGDDSRTTMVICNITMSVYPFCTGTIPQYLDTSARDHLRLAASRRHGLLGGHLADQSQLKCHVA